MYGGQRGEFEVRYSLIASSLPHLYHLLWFPETFFYLDSTEQLNLSPHRIFPTTSCIHVLSHHFAFFFLSQIGAGKLIHCGPMTVTGSLRTMGLGERRWRWPLSYLHASQWLWPRSFISLSPSDLFPVQVSFMRHAEGYCSFTMTAWFGQYLSLISSLYQIRLWGDTEFRRAGVRIPFLFLITGTLFRKLYALGKGSGYVLNCIYGQTLL